MPCPKLCQFWISRKPFHPPFSFFGTQILHPFHFKDKISQTIRLLSSEAFPVVNHRVCPTNPIHHTDIPTVHEFGIFLQERKPGIFQSILLKSQSDLHKPVKSHPRHDNLVRGFLIQARYPQQPPHIFFITGW